MNSGARPSLSCFWDVEIDHPFLFSIFWFPAFLLSLLWAFLAGVKRWLPSDPYRSKVPTVCVGNLTSGGSGKTPVVAAIAAHYSKQRPVIISRGFKGAFETAGGCVNLNSLEGARLFGDEPWMLAHQTGAPVYVGKNRRASVIAAEAVENPGLFIFDDGFQNRGVVYSKTILLSNPDAGPQASYCLPLGTLREPLSAEKRADIVLRSQKGGSRFSVEGPFDLNGKSVTLSPAARFGAFCGVGNPPAFFDSIKNKADIVCERPFSDHYWYTPSDIRRLNQLAEDNVLEAWLTTEKDWFRLGAARNEFRRPVYWTRLTALLDAEFFKALNLVEEIL